MQTAEKMRLNGLGPLWGQPLPVEVDELDRIRVTIPGFSDFLKVQARPGFCGGLVKGFHFRLS